MLTSPITAAKGDPETAMTRAEFLAKFDLLAGISLGREQRRAIEQAIAALPGSPSCEALFALLFEPAGAA
ncbi:hypothetical protein D3C78_1964480 [compost metagenome]